MASRAALTVFRSSCRPRCQAGMRIPVTRLLIQQRNSQTHASQEVPSIKYQAKIDQANKDWAAKAELIKKGEAYNLWDVLEERGYVKDVAGTREYVSTLMRDRRIGAYVGIDPTAPSLHLGHLLPLMPLFWMYMHGYGAVTLIGTATSKVGDPSGRLTSRDEVASSVLTVNAAQIHYQLKQIWGNIEDKAREFGYEKEWAWNRALVNNNTWWNKLSMLEVLKRLGSRVRIGPMLSRDTVKRKMTEGDGMSFAEFTYPLMQGWDWWHLYDTRDVCMQIGGSDQFGNIVAGTDTIKIVQQTEPNPYVKEQKADRPTPVGFTVPLLTDSSGAKFGKSSGNAVWVDPYKTTYFEQYGYFVRKSDQEVESLLKLFTFIPSSEIAKIMEEHNADPPKRLAQHRLAFEVSGMLHGRQVAQETQDQHKAMYGNKTSAPVSAPSPPSGSEYETPEGHVTLNNKPRADMILPRKLIEDNTPIARILHASGLVNSASEGNRLAKAGGAYIGGSPGQPSASNKGMDPLSLQFTPVKLWFPEDTKNFVIDDKYLILRKGRHNVRIIELVSKEEWLASGRTYPGERYKGNVRAMVERIKTLKEIAQGDKAYGTQTTETEPEEDEEDIDVAGRGRSSKGSRIVFPPEGIHAPDRLRRQVEALERDVARRRKHKQKK